MRDVPVSLLIVDRDRDLVGVIAAQATARGYRAVCATSLAELKAVELTDTAGEAGFDGALVDLEIGAEGTAEPAEIIRWIRKQDPDTEIMVTSATTPELQSFNLSAFAFVQKPLDIGQLFLTIDRAIACRRMTLDNRRLLWELQIVNEIADEISRSLELKDVLAAALRRLVVALAACGGSVRLKDPVGGQFEEHAFVGPDSLRRLWVDYPELPRPSDRVIATGASFLVDDMQALATADSAGLPVRSALSVPMTAGGELLGTLTIGAATPGRFLLADQRLVAMVAGQFAVATQNARLHRIVSRAKREWEHTFDAISDPIAVFDSRGALLRGNAALAAHLGRPVTGLRGASCRDVGFCDGACAECAITRALRNDGGRSELTRPDGQIFSVTTFPVAGGVDGASVVQVAKNVTEEIRSARRLRQMSDELALANARSMAALNRLKSTQAQLLQAEKLSAIGQLVAGVAHELNNPLTSVIGYAQLLEDELVEASGAVPPRPANDVAHDLRRIAEEAERAAGIVRNLLAFARRQTAERAPQDVVDLFTRVLSLRAYERRLNSVELETEFEGGLPPVVADGGQLQQALLNLLLNAEQSMLGRTPRRLRVRARFDDAAAGVELSISDTGHGIEPANLSRIFDPFFTTRQVGEGTGLGLSICYGIVRDHGGQITLESKVNVGTRFAVLLPARVETVAGEPILVAHQDQSDRDYLAAALTGWGHAVVTAESSAEALAICRRRPVQAVLVDRAVLAADLAGWREVRRAEISTIPVVVLSMAAEEGDVERFGREQASAVLAPPFQLRALRVAVRRVSRECV